MHNVKYFDYSVVFKNGFLSSAKVFSYQRKLLKLVKKKSLFKMIEIAIIDKRLSIIEKRILN